MTSWSLRLALPYPPSINHYYRRWQGRTIISAAGREFRRRVQAILQTTPRLQRLSGRLTIWVAVRVPDLRERDLDNIWKPLLDALQHGGLVARDSQFRDQRVVDAGLQRPDGQVEVFIRPFELDHDWPPR